MPCFDLLVSDVLMPPVGLLIGGVNFKDLKVAKALDMDNVSTLVLVEDAIDAQKGVVLARAFEPLTKQIVRTFEKHGIATLRIIDTAVDEGALIRALKKDPTRNEEEALKEIYKRLRPGEPQTTANAVSGSGAENPIDTRTVRGGSSPWR